MSQILTYPYGVKYNTSNVDTYKSQVKDGKNGSLPINDEIGRGDYQQFTGGLNWYGDSTGQDNIDSAVSGNYAFEQMTTGRGFRFWMQTSTNGKQTARWFDFGADPGREDGVVMNYNARASWLRSVTGIWFLANGADTTERNDCYSRIEHAAIRYADKDRKIRIVKATEKIGELAYMDGLRGTTKRIFGYQLTEAQRATVEREEYALLGARIQIQLRRGGSGTRLDTVSAGITGMRFSLGNATGTLYDNTKRALVGKGNKTWSEHTAIGETRLELETRP